MMLSELTARKGLRHPLEIARDIISNMDRDDSDDDDNDGSDSEPDEQTTSNNPEKKKTAQDNDASHNINDENDGNAATDTATDDDSSTKVKKEVNDRKIQINNPSRKNACNLVKDGTADIGDSTRSKNNKDREAADFIAKLYSSSTKLSKEDNVSEAPDSITSLSVPPYFQYPMEGITFPGPNDVLLGRGGRINQHIGHRRYLSMIDENRAEYETSSRPNKTSLGIDLVKKWRAQKPPGRFLKQDAKTLEWNDIGDNDAKVKIQQALREKVEWKRVVAAEDIALQKVSHNPDQQQQMYLQHQRFGDGNQEKSHMCNPKQQGSHRVQRALQSTPTSTLAELPWMSSQSNSRTLPNSNNIKNNTQPMDEATIDNPFLKAAISNDPPVVVAELVKLSGNSRYSTLAAQAKEASEWLQLRADAMCWVASELTEAEEKWVQMQHQQRQAQARAKEAEEQAQAQAAASYAEKALAKARKKNPAQGKAKSRRGKQSTAPSLFESKPARRNSDTGKNEKSITQVRRNSLVHDYHDHSSIPDSAHDFKRKGKGGVMVKFPEKLMNILDDQSKLNPDVVTWLPHGRAFVVRNQKIFVSETMPKYFRQSKWESFIRQLSLWGFRRITKEGGWAYYHEMFLRGRPRLCMKIQRHKLKGTLVKQKSDTDSEPNFYAMPSLKEETGDDEGLVIV